jgi:D-alanyl-D-alanine carboxypeptidase
MIAEHPSRRALLTASAAAALAGCRRALETGSPVAMVEESRRRCGAPGMAAIAVRSHGAIWSAFAGLLRRGGPEAVNSFSQFHLGSLAKAMTATMAATLVEEGRMEWSTTPADVFPEWRSEIHPAYARVTIDDLFRHRAGLPPFEPVGAGEFRGFPSFAQRADCARWVLCRPPMKNGGAPLYSNAGPSIAAVMAERVTGMRWERLMTDRVFAPLGMDAGFGWPAAAHPRQPWGHRPGWLGPQPVAPGSPFPLPDFFRPAGDIRASLNDYARFVQAHLAGLRGRDGMLRSAAVRRLHTPIEGYGLGWGVGEFDGALSSGHVGSAGSFLAVVSIWPTQDLAVTVAANLDSKSTLGACNGLVRGLHRALAATPAQG